MKLRTNLLDQPVYRVPEFVRHPSKGETHHHVLRRLGLPPNLLELVVVQAMLVHPDRRAERT